MRPLRQPSASYMLSGKHGDDMTFKHKSAKQSRVAYKLQPDGTLTASALIVTAAVTVKAVKSSSDGSALALLVRDAKKYADAAKIPSVIIESDDYA